MDANDSGRLEEARSELDELMKEKKLLGVPMLVLANKADLLSAKSHDEVCVYITSQCCLDFHHNF